MKKNLLNLKNKFWYWLINTIMKKALGTDLNKFEKILYFLLFPVEFIKWKWTKSTYMGYDYSKDIWTIYGIRYSGEIFRSFAMMDDWMKIVKREDGILTIKHSGLNCEEIKEKRIR